MKYLRYFKTSGEYTPPTVLPNVSYVVETEDVSYAPYVAPPISLCDIAYWDGSTVRTIPQSEWNPSLGTPVGVVVIPEGMLPDGKARMVGLKYATSAGTSSDSSVALAWGQLGTNTSLTKYTKVPTTDNAGSTSTGSNGFGYLPSDNFTGTQSYVDPLAKYSQSSNLIPSPYLGDNNTFNPEYSKAISEYNNALSDFDGLGNTQTLVGLGTGYTAANACWNYDGGVSDTNIQWYLPAAGELGFLEARFKAINAAITTVGGVTVTSLSFWSSSEKSFREAYYLLTLNGTMSSVSKGGKFLARAFAIIN